MQVVGYETRPVGDDHDAAILFAEEGRIDRLSLEPGDDLHYSIGDRHCAGTIDEQRHIPCQATKAPYCDVHTTHWQCARCTGDCTLPLEACREEHAVYLAAFAPDQFKVGVTRSWRLETRLREQGADKAAHLMTVADGRIARQIEAEIASDIGDRIRVPTKVKGFSDVVDDALWESLLEEYDPIATFDFEYGLELGERPMVETILTGTVRGTKGRVLVLETAGSVYAVNMRDLVGYEVTAEGTDRALQSSFSAFE